MRNVLCADIGSTFTKLTAVDLEGRRILGRARAFTTIETDVFEGFNLAFIELERQCGPLEFEAKLAASSAAGGLKMIAVGLVPELTVQAARLAVTGAGAKILKTFAFELSRDEVSEIRALAPDMVLLSGGIDGGNKEVIIHNARLLVESGLDCSLVVAGNKSAADELKEILTRFKGEVIFCRNVMPRIDQLDIEPARQAIRELFIRNIISAKGLDGLQKTLSAEIVPTPLAVFRAAELLSRGTKSRPGLGDLMLFDVGGATTDVYSMSEGKPTKVNVTVRGLREPFAKRSVEGDLGLRYSLPSLAEAAGIDAVAAALELPEAEVACWVADCHADPGRLAPAASPARRIDTEMAARAVSISMARHAGSVESVFTGQGQVLVQTGKDLSAVTKVIGTGGPIIDSGDPARVLGSAVWRPDDLGLLKPLAPELLVDNQYIMSAMGSLAVFDPEVALSIMLSELRPAQHSHL